LCIIIDSVFVFFGVIIICSIRTLYTYYEDNKFKRKQSLPPPIIVNDNEEYEVEEILDQRKHYGKIQNLIKRKRYPLNESSWEPEENLNCPELLKEFKNSHKY